MRVLCSSTPMEGVFMPFVPLGRALLAAGHEVLVATGPDLQSRVAGDGFATAVSRPDRDGRGDDGDGRSRWSRTRLEASPGNSVPRCSAA